MRAGLWILGLVVLGGCLDAFGVDRAVDERARLQEVQEFASSGPVRLIGAVALESRNPAQSKLADLQSSDVRRAQPDDDGLNGLAYSWTYIFESARGQLVRATASGTSKGSGTTLAAAEDGHLQRVARGAPLGDYALNSTQALARARATNATWSERLEDPSTDLVLAVFRPTADGRPYWLLTAWDRDGEWGASILVEANRGDVLDPAKALFPPPWRQDWDGVVAATGSTGAPGGLQIPEGHSRIVLHGRLTQSDPLSVLDVELSDGSEAQLEARLTPSAPEAVASYDRPNGGNWSLSVRGEGVSTTYRLVACLDNDADAMLLSPRPVREPGPACPLED